MSEPAQEPRPFQKFEALTKRLFAVSKKELDATAEPPPDKAGRKKKPPA